MNLSEIRERFRKYCGAAIFDGLVKDFHRQTSHNPFPTVQQERLWDDFTRIHSSVAFDPQLLRDVLDVCPLHLCELVDDTVPILYGLIIEEADLYEARRKMFPMAKEIVLGGCDIDDDNPVTQHAFYCPACRVAQQRWEQDRQK
jgi:hypothetical protein